jgi:hypothetical protein
MRNEVNVKLSAGRSRTGLVLAAASLVLAAGSPIAQASADCGPFYSCAELVYLGFTYPYPRVPGSFLFIDGAIYPYIHATDHLLEDSTVRLPDNTAISVSDLLSRLGMKDPIAQPLTPVIGYGSNPSPEQLSRKFAWERFRSDAVIPVMKGEIADYDVVWTPLFVGYGGMPATIAPSPGTEVDVWITWLGPAETARMNDSEGAGSLYADVLLAGAKYRFDGPQPNGVRLYVSCSGALTIDGETLAVAAVPARGRHFRAVNEAEALEAVFPTIGWTGSVLDLLHTNVTDPQVRGELNDRIRPLGAMPPFHQGIGDAGCSGRPAGGGKF